MAAVSVIIPTYKHEDFVVETLESVFAQTFADYEIIVVNDGSPDDTRRVLEPYVRAGRIRYIEQPNAGQAAARNRGLAEARGEFVAFLDDDDQWPADKLEWQVGALRARPEVDLVGGEVQTMGEPGRSPAGAGYLIDGEHILFGCPFTSPGQVLIRTAALRDVGGLDETLWGLDDFDLYARLALRRAILKVDRVALLYRLHPGNASKNRARMLRNGGRCVRGLIARVSLRRRWRAARQLYRGLYDFLGRDILRGLLSGDRSQGALIEGWRVWLGALAPGLLIDPRLAVWVAKDVLAAGREEAP